MEACDAALGVRVDPVARCAGFTALFDEHVAEVYRFVHSRCRDQAMAEDVTQDTFLTAVRTVDDPAEVTVGWLVRVARNRLLDIVRRQARYSGKLRLVGCTDQAPNDMNAMIEKLRMNDALDRLSIDQRLVLTLHYVDGLTVAALADELGRSAKAVESLVTRARRNLRRELENTDD
jgi:RNA polymerase sigma-70 factor (ECF subfamily)